MEGDFLRYIIVHRCFDANVSFEDILVEAETKR